MWPVPGGGTLGRGVGGPIGAGRTGSRAASEGFVAAGAGQRETVWARRAAWGLRRPASPPSRVGARARPPRPTATVAPRLGASRQEPQSTPSRSDSTRERKDDPPTQPAGAPAAQSPA